MKKIACFLVLVPLIVFQCSKDDTETKPDCGCEGTKVEEYINNATGTLLGTTTKTYYIYSDSIDIDGEVGRYWILFPCDTLIFAGKNFKENARVIYSGETKPTCPSLGRIGGSLIMLSKIELLM